MHISSPAPLIILIIFGEACQLWRCSIYNSLQPPDNSPSYPILKQHQNNFFSLKSSRYDQVSHPYKVLLIFFTFLGIRQENKLANIQFFTVSVVSVSVISLWSRAALLHPLWDCVAAVVVQMVTTDSVFWSTIREVQQQAASCETT